MKWDKGDFKEHFIHSVFGRAIIRSGGHMLKLFLSKRKKKKEKEKKEMAMGPMRWVGS